MRLLKKAADLLQGKFAKQQTKKSIRERYIFPKSMKIDRGGEYPGSSLMVGRSLCWETDFSWSFTD